MMFMPSAANPVDNALIVKALPVMLKPRESSRSQGAAIGLWRLGALPF